MRASGPAVASLQRLDAAGRAHHCFLEAADRCHYLWDYVPGAARARPHGWIWDLKCRGRQTVALPLQAPGRKHAMTAAAQALRAALSKEWIEQTSWAPIPPSHDSRDTDYDDRLLRLLWIAFDGYDADVRPLIRQEAPRPADHRGQRRLSFAELHGLLRVDTGQLAGRPLRQEVVLFDDVLTTGKHFKCAQARLYEALGPICISACFLARRVLSPKRRGRTDEGA